MDTREKTPLGPLYRYKGIVLLKRELDIHAESNEAFEEELAALLEREGLQSRVYVIEHVSVDREDALWH